MKFIATCKLGLEALVTRQRRELDIEVVETADARVSFVGGVEAMVKSLLWLRTAERVLLVVDEFDAETFDELFEKTKSVRWKQFLKPETNIHVTGKSAKSTLFSVSDCQSIVKKAIVENLKTAYRTQVIPEGGQEVIVEVGILRNHRGFDRHRAGAAHGVDQRAVRVKVRKLHNGGAKRLRQRGCHIKRAVSPARKPRAAAIEAKGHVVA